MCVQTEHQGIIYVLIETVAEFSNKFIQKNPKNKYSSTKIFTAVLRDSVEIIYIYIFFFKLFVFREDDVTV